MESTQKFYGDQNKNSEMTDHDNLLHETCYYIIMKTLTLECHSEEVLKNLLFFSRKQHAIYLKPWNALSFCLQIEWEQKYCGQTPADSNIGFILTNFCFAACNLTSLNVTKTNKPFPMDQMATGHIFILNWICKVIWIFAFYLCNFHCNWVYSKKKWNWLDISMLNYSNSILHKYLHDRHLW